MNSTKRILASVALLLLPLACSSGSGAGTATVAQPAPQPVPTAQPAPPSTPTPTPTITVGTCTIDAPRLQDPSTYGFGTSGFGPGGGSSTTLRGHTSGGSTGAVMGLGAPGGMRGRRSIRPKTNIGVPSVKGKLDKRIIQRYVRRNLARIKYCYEKQLLIKPTLSGRLTARFVIAANGSVSYSKAKGVDKKVAACVGQVIKAIRFPKPIAGKVTVAYPFVFSAGSRVRAQMKIGSAKSTSGLDKAIIRRYIRRKRRFITFCYERQLAVKPSLKGTVYASFTITAAGAVVSATAKGVSPAVSKCVASVLDTIRFPKPKGGGKVNVKYPFHFRSTGSAGGAGAGNPTIGSGRAGRRPVTRRKPAGVVVIQPVTIGGGPSNARVAIAGTIRSHAALFRRCFTNELAKHPSLSGKVVARFSIGKDGRVVNATATGVSAAVSACVAKLMSNIRFARQSAITKISFPFIFSNGAAPGPQKPPSNRQPPIADARPKPPQNIGDLATRKWGQCRSTSAQPITTRLPGMRACYAQALKRSPALAGRMQVSYYVDAKGTVPTSHTRGIGDAQFHQCIRSAFGATAAAPSTSYKAVRCEIVLDNGLAQRANPAGWTIRITERQVWANGSRLLPTRRLSLADDQDRMKREVIAALKNTLGTLPSAKLPVHFQIEPTVDIRAMEVMMHALVSSGHNRFLFYEKTGKGWELLSGYIPESWPGDCFKSDRLLEIRVSPVSIVMYQSSTTAFRSSGRTRVDDVGAANEAFKQTRKRWPLRKQVRIVVGGGQPYKVLSATIRSAVANGYTEPHVGLLRN